MKFLKIIIISAVLVFIYSRFVEPNILTTVRYKLSDENIKNTKIVFIDFLVTSFYSLLITVIN